MKAQNSLHSEHDRCEWTVLGQNINYILLTRFLLYGSPHYLTGNLFYLVEALFILVCNLCSTKEEMKSHATFDQIIPEALLFSANAGQI